MSGLAPAIGANGALHPAYLAPRESSSGADTAARTPGERPAPPGFSAASSNDPVLITGGAGFIGCNLAEALLSRGRRVRLFDNLSRPGADKNLAHLRARHGERLQLRLGDVRDPHAVEAAVRGAGPVFHFAARVAVTTSLSDPVADFDINARGTLNLLEALRRSPRRHDLVFASTSEVYGPLEDLPLEIRGKRYAPVAADQSRGVDEDRRLAFHSPHACSKGAADQYVLGYARSFGLPALVLRLGCVYGPHQWGDARQDRIAHLLASGLAGRPVTIHADARQVRDALHVDDLVDALLRAEERIDALSGRAFNLGGGPAHSTSLLELIELVGELQGAAPAVEFAAGRAGDPRHYVSDIRRFGAATDWAPRVGLADGVGRLHRWLAEHARPAPELATSSAS